ncbi:unnamed protein product [Phytomonas sp. Hart1]|nr:unnamed protein product [Phytomonas sp. Hart1]|eukprot:CCW69289.1 unnamed protein product [Phytomonas sp. isolate Hart1]
MLRRTVAARIKPYLHAFSPGVRPSEKGALYRNNNQNSHARVSALTSSQRTASENRTFVLLGLPDQMYFGMVLMITCIIVMYLSISQRCFSANGSKQNWMMNQMNEHEFYARNDEMGQIFNIHSEMIENSRRAALRPPVFTVPSGYSSFSGKYAPENQ